MKLKKKWKRKRNGCMRLIVHVCFRTNHRGTSGTRDQSSNSPTGYGVFIQSRRGRNSVKGGCGYAKNKARKSTKDNGCPRTRLVRAQAVDIVISRRNQCHEFPDAAALGGGNLDGSLIDGGS